MVTKSNKAYAATYLVTRKCYDKIQAADSHAKTQSLLQRYMYICVGNAYFLLIHLVIAKLHTCVRP